ncbi:MAG: ATP-binding protein [Vicinamibacterales bacterium]
MSLRVRLIGAFAVVLAALAGLGGWNAWRLWEMGAVSNRIIADNFDSVVAAQQMKESLERQDSGRLFLLLGQEERGERQLREHRALFEAAFDRAASNITEVGEAEVIESIRSQYAAYSALTDPSAYFSDAEPRFNRLRAELDRLLAINQDAMRRKSAEAAAIARTSGIRAIVVAAVLTMAGILMVVLFAGTLLRSIGRLTTASTAIAAGNLDVTVPVTGGDEIARLATSFNEMAGKLREVRDSNLGELMRARQILLENVDQLRQLDRLKSAFVAAAAHELRTPLMTFQMGVHLLIEESGTFNARQRELLDLCRDESAKLVRLSTELLDLSKIESGEAAPRLAKVPVAALLGGAIDPLRMMIDTHGISLAVDVPADVPPALADRTQVERVVTNLMTNAVRATPAGGSITVSARRAGSRIGIAVADTGHGIPPEYLERIFVPFIQVPGPPAGGAGLGLAISKRIIEAHGGTLSVESIPGAGSTFRFTLATA